jgi:hypothetical protein
VHLFFYFLTYDDSGMQEIFREQRPKCSFSDRRGTGLVDEFDEARSADDRRASQAAPVQPAAGGWWGKIARGLLHMAGARNRLESIAYYQLSKGWAKRMYLTHGARISCRSGKIWITLDEGGEDIVLAACESRNFGPGSGVLVEALATSRISLEAL